MKKDIPRVYVNKINKINNNQEVYYSFKDNNDNSLTYENNTDIITNEYQLQNKIDELFRSKDFIYKKKFHIKTKYCEGDYIIISKSYDYLLTIKGEKIYIANILEIS